MNKKLTNQDIETLLFEVCQEKVFLHLLSIGKQFFSLSDYREAWNACGAFGNGPSDDIATEQILSSKHTTDESPAGMFWIRPSSVKYLSRVKAQEEDSEDQNGSN